MWTSRLARSSTKASCCADGSPLGVWSSSGASVGGAGRGAGGRGAGLRRGGGRVGAHAGVLAARGMVGGGGGEGGRRCAGALAVLLVGWLGGVPGVLGLPTHLVERDQPVVD